MSNKPRKPRVWKMWAAIIEGNIFAYDRTRNALRRRGYIKPVRVEVREADAA